MNKLCVLLTLLISLHAKAGLIEIGLSTTTTQINESIHVNLTAKNFTEAFDTFDFDFNFDHSLFEFVDGSFTSDLTLFSPLSFTATPNTNGLAISYLDFFAVTNANFLLASFELKALKSGTSTFSFTSQTGFSIFDIFSGQSEAVVTDFSHTKQATTVPEPNSWILMLPLLILLMLQRSKNNAG